MNFSEITNINIPEGSVSKITDSKGFILWEKQGVQPDYPETPDLPIPLANEIYYTSTDGNIVRSGLDSIIPNLVSDIYRNELGKITFNQNLNNIPDSLFAVNIGGINLESVIIPYSVKSIGEGVFTSQNKLQTVYIPNSVKSIGVRAFYGCSSLTSITIPDSVTSIGDKAFYSCTSLTTLTLPKNLEHIGIQAIPKNINLKSNSTRFIIENDCLIDSQEHTLIQVINKLSNSIIIPNSVTSIGAEAFYGCSSLTSITIPDSVTSIGDKAFYSCTSLTTLTLPKNLEYVGIKVVPSNINLKSNSTRFIVNSGCLIDSQEKILLQQFDTSLYSFSIPDSVTSIGTEAFYYLTKPTTVNIPNNITSIGKGAFSYCKNLTTVTISNSVTSIGSSAFSNCTSLTSITIPDSVTYIGSNAFSNCSSLTSITIPDSVTSINSGIFNMCTKLTSVNFSDTVSFIDERAFKNTAIYNIKTTPYINKIGYGTYQECDRLTSINIPNTITSINDYAFYGCYHLETITIPDSVTYIGEKAFFDCYNLKTLTLPKNLEHIGIQAISEDVSLTSNSTRFIVENGCLIDSQEHTLIQLVKPSSNSLVIPNTINSIGDKAVCSFFDLKSITIPDSVTYIGASAFTNCTAVNKIICYAKKAPLLMGYCFYKLSSGILQIPENSSAYDTWLEQLGDAWTIEYITE